jgi:serine protease Do
MSKPFSARARRWAGASIIAIAVAGLAGAGWAVEQGPAPATLQPAALIQAPQSNEVLSKGFADLVDAVKPAVVSVYVQAHGNPDESPGDDNSGNGDNGNGSNGDNGNGSNGDNGNGDNGDSGGGDNGGGDNGGNGFQNLPPNSPLYHFFQQFGAVPPKQIQHYEAAGSGFAISPDGYFVTNNHVVENADKVTVVFDDGTQKTAKIVGTDQRTDLAVLKVDGLSNQPFVKFAGSPPRVGDWVMAIGNPFGLGGTVTQGVVSAEGRDIGGSSYGDFLQIDAAVNRGNSGGPTFNLQGEVVGVNTEIYSPNGGSVGIAFDIPSSIVKQITDQLIKTGKVTRGALGVEIQDLTPDIASSMGINNTHGAVVTQPEEGSPAAKAGVQSGDVITAVDGQTVTDALDLSRTIASKPPGTNVNLTVVRNGKQMQIAVTLETLPAGSGHNAAQPAGPTQSSVGLTLAANPHGPGVIVEDVDPNGVAATRGFAAGDVILEVNHQQVSSGQDVEQQLQAVKASGRHAVLVKVQRNGQVRYVGLPLAGGSESGND